jgi:hypothetical protein
VLGIVALVALVVATLTTNLAANVVAPANSFSALRPRRVSFRLGGLIAGLIGIGIFPWKLLDRYQTWLIGYSGLLGAVAGVIVCDYLVIRRGRLDVPDLYAVDGRYAYTGGVTAGRAASRRSVRRARRARVWRSGSCSTVRGSRRWSRGLYGLLIKSTQNNVRGRRRGNSINGASHAHL